MNTNEKRTAVLKAADRADAERYRKLRAHMEQGESLQYSHSRVTYFYSVARWFGGRTFDAAVDALPEPEGNMPTTNPVTMSRP
jgi:hypothetical protein